MSHHGLLPPRRRDWKRGQAQIGTFIRTPEGRIVEMVNDNATERAINLLSALNIELAKEPVKE